ncbi:oligosaccharide flippase family protein [Halomonas sp. RA08-2]|uniref:oligosaccharide flippase family protein n=1 Tax=Halomonas sp. RA08-2 TaxID=3440842 RepID=UPI003EF002A5
MSYIKKSIKPIIESKFVKNVSKLVSGTIAAQIITFITIPILARTYSQEAFGLLAAFSALVGFVSSFATLKYDTALVLPKKDVDAYKLLKLSNVATIVITMLCVTIMYLPIDYFEEYQGLQMLVGAGVILSVNYNNSALWNIRFKRFNHTAISRVIQSVAVFTFQYALYHFYELKGLVIGSVLGVFVSGIYLIATRKFNWSTYRKISVKEMKAQGRRYIDFPKYFTASNAILSFSSSLPVLLFVKYIPLSQVGIYGVALSIVSQPVVLIANNVRSVVLGDMAGKKNNNQSIIRWYRKIFICLLALSLLASLGLIVFGDWFIGLFLGTEWAKAALYAKMLIPLLIGQMIASPGIAAVRVFEMQKYNFLYSIASLAVKVTTLLGLFMWDVLPFEQIILVYSLVSLVLIFVNNSIILLKIIEYEKNIATN